MKCLSVVFLVLLISPNIPFILTIIIEDSTSLSVDTFTTEISVNPPEENQTTESPENQTIIDATTEESVIDSDNESVTEVATAVDDVTDPSILTTTATSSRTSTTKVNSDYFSQTNSEGCESKAVKQHTELSLPDLSLEGNLTWGQDLVENNECVSEYVVMYRYTNESSSIAAVLCPGYKVGLTAGVYWCEYSLPEYFCEKELEIFLEIWTFNNFMIQPKTNVVVSCQTENKILSAKQRQEDDIVTPEEKNEVDNVNSEDMQEDDLSLNNTDQELIEIESKEDGNWQFPLVFASINLLNSVANNITLEEMDICSWSSWSSWSDCSITCGGRGRRSRTRSQIGKEDESCSATEEGFQDCVTNLCSINCEWEPWGYWSKCSMSCGRGIRKRTRKIAAEAEYGGKKCGNDSEEVEECIDEVCPVDGVWSTWTRWGYCSKTCGVGSRSRSRTCTEPEAQFGGKPCDGISSESKQCYRDDCPPVDGGWSTWGRWSQCSTTCGKGEQRRLRSCTAPMPSGEGRMCTGESFETNNCILRLCLTEGTLEPGTDLLRTNILGANRLFVNFNNQNSKNRIFNKNQISLSRINQNKIRQNHEPTNMAESEDKMADRSAVQPIENLPEKNLICGNAPYIFGFGDPVVQSDGRIMYTCTQGRVLDTRTNRRRFIAECDRFGFLNMTLVPECRAATHCLGPVHRPGTNADIVSTVPQRDVEINTAIKYICSSGRDIFGTCFFDGRPRYPGYSDQLDQIMDQSMDQSEYLANNLKYNSSVCSIPETNKVENGGTETLLLEERMFGWLSLPDYPSFSSISSFTWFLTFPQHSFMVLGVEQIRNEDNTPEDWLELIYQDNQVLLNETHKRTSFFIYSNATIRLLESTKRRKFRLSYIMM